MSIRPLNSPKVENGALKSCLGRTNYKKNCQKTAKKPMKKTCGLNFWYEFRQFWSETTSTCPKWPENAQKAPKMSPKWPKRPHRGPLGPGRAFFGPLWAHFRHFFEHFQTHLGHVEVISDQNWRKVPSSERGGGQKFYIQTPPVGTDPPCM